MDGPGSAQGGVVFTQNVVVVGDAGLWWQGLVHQFAKLDVFDVEDVRLRALPDTPGVRAGMYGPRRARTHRTREGSGAAE
jgi:hypothetical protein